MRTWTPDSAVDFYDVAEDVGERLDRHAVGVDAMDEVLAVKFEDRLGFLFVDDEALADDVEVRVVEAGCP